MVTPPHDKPAPPTQYPDLGTDSMTSAPAAQLPGAALTDGVLGPLLARDAATGGALPSPGWRAASGEVSVPVFRSTPPESSLPTDALRNPLVNFVAGLYAGIHGLRVGRISFDEGVEQAACRVERLLSSLGPGQTVSLLSVKPGHEDHVLSILLLKDEGDRSYCLLADSLGTDYGGYPQESIPAALGERLRGSLYGMPTTQYSATGCLSNALLPIRLARYPGFIGDLLTAMRRCARRYHSPNARVLDFEDLKSCPDLLLFMQDRRRLEGAAALRLKYGPQAGQSLLQAWQGDGGSVRNTLAPDGDAMYEAMLQLAQRGVPELALEDDAMFVQRAKQRWGDDWPAIVRKAQTELDAIHSPDPPPSPPARAASCQIL